jgi:nicotinamide-nucleotide amidase
MRSPSASIVTIGDELLNGDRLDTNARWLARFLSATGFDVAWMSSAADDEEQIGRVLAAAAEEAELVVATGGLGPTLDDRTREAVSKRWGRPLTEDPVILEELRADFLSRGYHDLPETNRRVARVPEGAGVIRNSHGSAPALHLRVPVAAQHREALVLLLPGVPAEMQGFLEGRAGEFLRESMKGRLRAAERRILRTTGIPESALAGRLEAILDGVEDVAVAYRPSIFGVEVVLSARGDRAFPALERACDRVGDALAAFLYDDPDGDIAGSVGRALDGAGLRIAVAESCTGGLLMKRLTDVPGSSGWVAGGVVAYANRIKVEHLGVSAGLIEAQGSVSEGVARAMAEGVRSRMGAELGVGITGIAGPGGAVADKPVGTVWFGIAGPRGTHAERVQFPGGRHSVRERAAQHALHLVLRSILAPGRNERVQAG